MKKVISMLLLIYFVLFFLFYILGITVFGNAKIVEYSSYAIVIPVFLSMIIEIGRFICLFIKALLKTKKWYFIVLSILVIVSITLFLIGSIIFFLGTSTLNNYRVDMVTVVDVKNNKLLVGCSNYYNGDCNTIEVYKPFFVNVKKGDLIDVRYPINDPKKMYYVVHSNIGEQLFGIGLLTGIIVILISIIAIVIMAFIN